MICQTCKTECITQKAHWYCPTCKKRLADDGFPLAEVSVSLLGQCREAAIGLTELSKSFGCKGDLPSEKLVAEIRKAIEEAG